MIKPKTNKTKEPPISLDFPYYHVFKAIRSSPSISLETDWELINEYRCPHCHTPINDPQELDFCFGCLSWVEKKDMEHYNFKKRIEFV